MDDLRVQELLSQLARADDMDDVNTTLVDLCEALGFETPVWDYDDDRFTFEWEDQRTDDE